MQEVFEKIIEKLEEIRVKKTCNKEKCDTKELCRICVVDEAIKIVKEVAEEYDGGWIACSDRLPEKNGMYLCTQNSYDLATNKNIIRVSTELVEFYNGKWRRAKNLVITHWQPLPEPFKESD